LVQASDEDLTVCVGRIRNEGWTALRPVFPVLHRIGAPLGVELALSFVGNEDPRVRVEAVRLLLALDDREGQVPRYIEKALLDESPRVVGFAIKEARQRGGPDMTYLLAAFLKADTGRDMTELRVQAIAALASFRTVPARDALIAFLRSRKVAFSVKAERISSALEEALVAIGDDESVKAVRLWRRSLARWLTVLLVRGKVKDE
jgi:HEAT repeat protein